MIPNSSTAKNTNPRQLISHTSIAVRYLAFGESLTTDVNSITSTRNKVTSNPEKDQEILSYCNLNDIVSI